MKDAEKKLRELIEETMKMTENEADTTFRLLDIVEPSDLAEMGFTDALRECLEENAGNMDDDMIDEISRIVYPEK